MNQKQRESFEVRIRRTIRSNRSPDVRSVIGLQLLVELLMISDNFHLISYLISLLFQCVEKNWDKSSDSEGFRLKFVNGFFWKTWNLKFEISNWKLRA